MHPSPARIAGISQGLHRHGEERVPPLTAERWGDPWKNRQDEAVGTLCALRPGGRKRPSIAGLTHELGQVSHHPSPSPNLSRHPSRHPNPIPSLSPNPNPNPNPSRTLTALNTGRSSPRRATNLHTHALRRPAWLCHSRAWATRRARRSLVCTQALP